MQVTDKVTLNLSGEELFAPIFARQGDLNSRIVEATLQFDEALYEIPENTKVVVTYRSANGKSDIHDGAVSGANTVTFPLIPLLLSAPGRARCDVELYNSGDMLGTGLLYVDVTPIAAKSGALEASPEYQTFVDAIADMTNKTADADEAINNANTAAEAANTAAQNADEKATAAQTAADAANTAKAGADAAAGRANTAATGADTAANSASAAATRATTAAEEAEKVISDVSGELGNIVDTQISGQKGRPNGIASLDSSGKLVQMPTAADVGALATDTIAAGSNSNGYWRQIGDTVECWQVLSFTLAGQTGNRQAWVYPIPVASVLNVQLTAVHDSNAVMIGTQVALYANTQATIAAYNPSSGQYTVKVLAYMMGKTV